MGEPGHGRPACMRAFLGAGLCIMLGCLACDKEEAKVTAPAPSATSAATPAPSASVRATADAGSAAFKMPERPIPRPQTTVGATMPIEVQQKAIGYMVAMRAPRPDEAPADATFAGELAEKLKPILLSMDTGADKARMNRVEVIAAGRQIDMLLSSGCDAKAPTRAVVQRAGTSLAELVSHGVLVLRCNDARVQCLQSTRDTDDVLCTTAPRHK